MDEAVGAVLARLRTSLGPRRLVVVSNREPYEHRWSGGQADVAVARPAGGLTSALDPVMQAAGGTWVAWGSGEADPAAVDAGDRVEVPPENPGYTLRRVWLSDHDIHRYYLGYSNQTLWPLCHFRPDLVRVSPTHWERYREVNRRFAEAVLDEVRGEDAAVWFQDYHLVLAPGLVRARRPDLTLAHFWHIPFPPPDLLRVAPHAEELLRGILANDLLGFQIPRFAENFLRCAGEVAGAEVDLARGTATLDGHTCHVRALPISIDAARFRESALAAGGGLAELRARYAPAGGAIALGVDRMDYSKGLMEKLAALALLWDRCPELRGALTLVQIAVPSRMDVEPYDRLSAAVEARVEEINARFGTPRWRPVHLVSESIPADVLAGYYRMAELCLVTSLQDGMNLVAKEYVACQIDCTGVLILSEFAGAAGELREAVRVNPHDAAAVAGAIRSALLTPERERAAAMEAMQGGMRSVYDWMEDVLAEWGAVGPPSGSASRFRLA